VVIDRERLESEQGMAVAQSQEEERSGPETLRLQSGRTASEKICGPRGEPVFVKRKHGDTAVRKEGLGDGGKGDF